MEKATLIMMTLAMTCAVVLPVSILVARWYRVNGNDLTERGQE